MIETALFKELVPLLINAIPDALSTRRLPETICCLRIYYYDTHAPCTYLTLSVMTERHRKQLLDTKGRDALFYLWSAGELDGDNIRERVDVNGPPPITAMFKKVYKRLCSDHGELSMLHFRKVVHKVAYALNEKNWAGRFPVTDDFVFVAADGSQAFADQYVDLIKSIPPDRLNLLRDRGLLGPDREWEQRPGFEYAVLEKVMPDPPDDEPEWE
jgi:hypothetical protein